MTAERMNSQGWMAQHERGFTPLIKSLAWISLRIGRTAARLLLYPICAYFLLFAGKARAASKQYLSKVFGRPPSVGEVFLHFFTFANCVLDRVYLLNGQTDLFEITSQGDGIVADILKEGNGCLLFGAHLGSFEVLSASAHMHPGLRVCLVMYEQNARKTNTVLRAINPRSATEVIALGQPSSMLKVEDRLNQNYAIGILADRSLNDERRIQHSLLGSAATFPIGPFRMAAMLGRPIVLMFGLYRGGCRYDIYFERLCDGSNSPEEALRRYVERVEHYCRMAPYNWFNFYDFWK